MKNYEAHYPVEGSVARKSDSLGNIIEFPGQQGVQYEKVYVFESEDPKQDSFFQSLKNDSIQGKVFGLAKPWQSWLAGTFFLAFAIACVFLAN